MECRACRSTSCILLLLWLCICGCRANPFRLACTAIGSAVDDAYLKKLEPQLIGQPPEASDEVFGRRLDTLADVGSDARMLVYVAEAEGGSARYIVEVNRNKIRALYKTQRNISGAADALQADAIQAKIAGRSPDEFGPEVGLRKPALTLHSSRTDSLIRVYDAPGQVGLGNRRYCVVEFDRGDRCREVRVVGLMAATKSGSLTR